MPSGKLKIEGTITIKDGKSKKKRKTRKPRKKKDTTGYTGTGTTDTRQEFGQPYTAAAVLNAAMLRSMSQFQQPLLQPSPPKIEQPSLTPVDTYYRIEDLPRISGEQTIQLTKREFIEKAVPFLERSTQERVQEYKTLAEQELQQLRDQSMLEQDRIARDLAKANEEARNEQRKQMQRLEQNKMFHEEELTKNYNFFENELQQQRSKFQKELTDIAYQAEQEKAMLQQSSEAEKLMLMTSAQLIKKLKEYKPNFNPKDEEGNPKSKDDLRFLLQKAMGLNLEGVQTTGRGRPTIEYRPRQQAAAVEAEPEFYDVLV